MKKSTQKLALIGTCLFMTLTAHSQTWSQNGNGLFPPPWSVAIPANQLLGTTAAFPLRFITTSAERMRILANGRVTVNTPFPLVLGTALDAQVTINSGVANGVFGTTSGGLNPRIYFETRNSGFGNNQAMCHSVPSGPFLPISQATSGILWDNIDFINFRSNFHINTRTAAYGALNALTVEQGFGRVGINNGAAGNRLVITTLNPDPYFLSGNGSSGLRFTNLTSLNTPVPNPGPGVLALDDDGDVIYVDALTAIGNYCGALLTNPLTGDFEIRMANHNYYFNDNLSTGALFNNVGIGTTTCSPLIARLEVINPVMNFGVKATTTALVPFSFGVHGTASGAATTSTGVAGEAIVAGSLNTTGIYGHANSATFTSVAGDFLSDGGGSTSNIGVRARASGNSATFPVQGVFGTAQAFGPTATARGGDFTAFGSEVQNSGVVGNVNFTSGTTSNYGGAFRAVNGKFNYAVYAQVATSSTPTGVPTTPPGPNYAGYFLGDVYISGLFGPSDQNMKENIIPITNADSIINLLNPVYFDFIQTGQWSYLALPQGNQTGLKAQDVESIMPDLVKTNHFPDQYDSLGNIVQAGFDFKTIDYAKFIPLLISSNKNLNEKVSSLEDRITTLENCINGLNLCDSPSMIAPNDNSNNGNATNVELKDAQTIILDQNVPNPFAEMTTITYALSDGVKKAQMLFYNATGKLINSQDLQTTSGKGTLNVFANDLSNGIYTYTLVVDGKIIDTKRMVKNK